MKAYKEENKVFKRVCKKLAGTICIIGIAAMLSNVVGAMQSFAAETAIISKGNIIMKQVVSNGTEKATVAIYTSDIQYLKNEIDELKSQL